MARRILQNLTKYGVIRGQINDNFAELYDLINSGSVYNAGFDINHSTPTIEQFDNMAEAIKQKKTIIGYEGLSGNNRVDTTTIYTTSSFSVGSEGDYIYLYHLETRENRLVIEGIRFWKHTSGEIEKTVYIRDAISKTDIFDGLDSDDNTLVLAASQGPVIETMIDTKQNMMDEGLNTESKYIVGAINELHSKISS